MLMKNDQFDASTPRQPGLRDDHFLDLALALAAKGARVHPLRVNGKEPTTATGFMNGLDDATSDPETIRRMWTLDGVVQHYNIGRATGRGVIALDVDISKDKKGVTKAGKASFEALVEKGLDAETYIVRSARGGLHLLYAEPESNAYRNSNRRLKKEFPGLDVKTDGGYLVAPGSVIDGKTYEVVKDLPVAPLPDALRRYLVRVDEDAPERQRSGTEPGEWDDPSDIDRAIQYLARVKAEGIPAEGDGSDNFTYGVIARLRDFGISEYMACELTAEHYTPHTTFDQEWVDAKVANAYRHAQNAPGVASIKAIFKDMGDPEPVSEASAVFAAADLNALKKSEAEAIEPIKWVRPSEWSGVEPPEREWDVVGWVPRYEVTLLYGDGGIGKTLIIHQLATAMAAGVSWLGQETRQRRVMCFFCEDSEDELLRRQIDINRALGVEWGAIDDRLRIASRKYMDNLLALWDRNTGAMKRAAVWQQLRDDAVAFGADVVIVDTIADTHGGSEIDRGQVNAFVKSCLGRLAKEINGSVIALGHPSTAGKSSGSGTSGSTAWSNAVRSRMYLRYPKGVEKGNVRELEGMKLNYGPKGNLLKLRWQAGAFVLVASSKPADVAGADAGAALMAGASIEDVARNAVLDALRRCGDARMSLASNSANYAPKVLKKLEPDLLEALSLGEVEEALRRLEREGAIAAGKVGMDEWRKPVHGLVVRDIVSGDAGIFG